MAAGEKMFLTALNRFGLGGRRETGSGERQRIAKDARAFVKADLDSAMASTVAGAPTRAELAKVLLDVRAERQRARSAQAAMDADGAPSSPLQPPAQARSQSPAPPNPVVTVFRDEAMAAISRSVIAPCGFAERLVAFWANHFCVSAGRGPMIRLFAGAFEREAIRPHVLGNFADMLLAVEQHPAMLAFLDNSTSIGPNSRAGQRRGRGLNENLAREILELHTLGVNGGYSQQDVGALARIITGWSFGALDGRQGAPGDFFFNANTHEPGTQTLLGKTYAQPGVGQGIAALRDLAAHPTTAKFVATKLVRHFVADDPPPAIVDRLAGVFSRTGGDLRAVSLALVDDDQVWAAPLTKIRAPRDFIIAILRLTGFDPGQPGRVLNPMAQLGQPFWSPAGPDGFADTNAVWASSEGMKLRLELSSAIGQRLGGVLDARQALDAIGGDGVSMETRRAIAGAASRQQGLALALMSPEFQRR
jgi:uncharacterized protein (DUF1800 family)